MKNAILFVLIFCSPLAYAAPKDQAATQQIPCDKEARAFLETNDPEGQTKASDFELISFTKSGEAGDSKVVLHYQKSLSNKNPTINKSKYNFEMFVETCSIRQYVTSQEGANVNTSGNDQGFPVYLY